MRQMILGLALLGAAPVAALAQMSPATPDRNPPAAAMENSTRPDAARPAPGVTPRRDSVQNQTPGNATPSTMSPGSASTGNTTTGNATTPGNTATGAATPNMPSERGNAAVRTEGSTASAEAPRSGANSFTEGQARSRIESAGFSGVTELRRDDQGVWRARAMRGGQQTNVALDFQGNVSAQ